MTLIVHYVRDLSDPQSDTWQLNPLWIDLASVLAVAREGYARVEEYAPANGFRIVDEAGFTIAEEHRARS
ncbi:MAG: hypothetical protein ABL889_18625 [Terricaulis sp.]